MIRTLILGKPAHTGIEFVRFLPVGAVTTVIDFGTLILLTEHFHVHYLLSAAIGFLLGQVWSYYMCINWIFAKSRITSHVSGFTYFIVLSVVGLVITELFLWFFTEQAGWYYIYSKILSSAVSFLTLFYVRKRFLFS
jgi:putative flippase GtrA